ncbi:MAG TPA: hypothetical protein VJO14_02910, partial [Bacteroidota bacterium]|nr:hypothetical protein [Bacteroidota bacterium]
MQKNAMALTTLLLLLLSFTPALSQVTNLIVNGSSTNFTMTSGDVVSWSYNLPAGEAAIGEIWIDLNTNQAIDPGTDRRLLSFTETDGDTIGYNGPPDMDGLVNGAIQLTMPVGLAPQAYVLKFSNNGVGQSVWGSVDPLASPAYTISGTVSGPVGADLQYIMVEASSSGDGTGAFWQGLTDSSGQYTIEMDSDTSGNPWEVRINDVPPPYTVVPQDTFLTIAGNFTGIDFTLIAAAAQVVGYIIDDSGDSLADADMVVSREDSGMSNYLHYTRTDPTGKFWFGIPLYELDGHTWRIFMPYTQMPITTHMLGFANLPVLGDGDSINQNVVSYTVNST